MKRQHSSLPAAFALRARAAISLRSIALTSTTTITRVTAFGTLAASGVLAIALIGACSSPKPAPATDGGTAGAVIVGIQGEQIAGSIASLHVTTSIGGVALSDETLAVLAHPELLPKEIRLDAPTTPGVEAHVRIEGFAPPPLRGIGDGGVDVPTGGTALTTPVLVRTATTLFVPGETKLLRLNLENRCIVTPPFFAGCSQPGQTCVSGVCRDEHVDVNELEPYSANWAVDAPDACKPQGHGDPIVVTGTGQTDFLPVTDGTTLTAERGPQGGHHVWVAVRMKNLKQSGSTTTIRGKQPDTAVEIPPTSFIFTFDPDEGSYCKLYGLRYQLDNGGIDYKQFLGKPLDITVTVTDSAGSTGESTAHVNIAPTVLGDTP